MNPIFTSLGDRELRITLDAESDWYNELINIGKAGGSFTLEHGGRTVFGCKVDTVAICASGNGGTLADIVVKLPPAPPFLRTAIVHTKYRLKSDEHNEELQNRLFELGAKWKTKGNLATTPRKINGRFLFVSNQGTLAHSDSAARYGDSTATELNYHDLLDIQQGRTASKDHARLRGLNGQRSGTVTGRWPGGEPDFTPNPFGDPCDMSATNHFVNKGRRAGMTMRSLAELEQRVTGNDLRGSIMKNSWKFDSVHPKDIDFDEITSAVTRQFPVAIVKGTYTTKETRERAQRTTNGNIKYEDGTIRAQAPRRSDEAGPLLEDYKVTVKHDENYLVVHKTLIDKAFVINMQLPEGKTPWRANGNGGSRVFRGITTAQLSAWIKWAKDVKAAPWHDEDRRKVTFEVNLVSV